MITPEHLIDYLRNTPAITAAVGTVGGRNVISGEINGALAKVMPRRAIIVTPSGGPDFVGNTHNFSQSRMDVRCYGQDVQDCWALANTLYEHFRHRPKAAMNGRQTLGIRQTGGGVQDYHPDQTQGGNWPFVFLEYTIVMTEV